MSPWTKALTCVAACSLPFLAGCRAGIDEAHFDEWDGRIADLIEQASAVKTEQAETLEGTRRDESIRVWDAVLRALMFARVAGSLAYMADDGSGLESVERDVEQFVAQFPELAAR